MLKKLLLAIILGTALLLVVFFCIALADGPVVEVDLASGEEDYRVIAESALHYLGELATGDINADGIPDLIIGASGYDVTGTLPITNAGAVYVIFGSSDLTGTLDLNSTGEEADVTIYGVEEDGYAGHSVASGDVNGDGYADIVIGADLVTYMGRPYAGAVYVVHGPITGAVPDPIHLDDPDWVGLTVLYGQYKVDRFGRAVATGDVNGDGTDDLIVSAYWADRPDTGNDCGRTYVFTGSANLTGTLDLSTHPASVEIIGAQGGDRLGRSLVAGDVNGDGVEDLIIGAYRADPEGRADAGEVVLIYGGDSLSPTIDLAHDNLTGSGLGLVFYGIGAGDGVGFYVGAGNVNGDENLGNGVGYADILVSGLQTAGGANEDGEGYIIYGGPAITDGVTIGPATWGVDIADCVDVTVYPDDAGDRLGRSLTSGDVNGDGYDDFIIGASRADPSGRTDAGETYVFYGGTDLPSTITVDPTGNTDITILGDGAYDESGRSCAAGDLNGDGVDDLIVGAVMADVGPLPGAGEVYVIWGPGATSISVEPSADPVTAGQPVSFTVTAQNDHGQTWDVMACDTTFDIAPAAGGSWNGNVYTTAVAGTWVVTATYVTLADEELTADTTLTVDPGALDRFVFDPISDQKAGQFFSVTITAQDEYENTVTGYAGPASLSDTTGTIQPTTTTGSFSGGKWTGDVEITQPQDDVIITAQDDGALGTSNPFDVYRYRMHLPLVVRSGG